MKISKATIVQTVIEAVTLIGWLALTQVNAALAVAVLLVGLFLEHLVAFNGNRGRSLFRLSEVNKSKVSRLAIVETLIWIVWLMLVNAGVGVGALIFLIVGLIFAHKGELSFLSDCYAASLKDSILISVIEGITAALWVGLGGITGKVVLVVGLLVEHIFQGKKVKELMGR